MAAFLTFLSPGTEAVPAAPSSATGTEAVVRVPPPVSDSTVEIEQSDQPAAVAESAAPTYDTFVPIVSNPLILNPQTAVLDDIQGAVEIQAEDGTWTVTKSRSTLKVGQRIRTGAAATAKLTFFDGSQATLKPNAEISIDALDAKRPAAGFRTVVMTQWLGESEHDVQFRNDRGSRYEVKTPSGSAVARGTTFTVLVTPDLIGLVIVAEGVVAVTNLNVTVLVIAGQITIVNPDAEPTEPAFAVTGEGEVTAIGATWTISGQQFETTESTIIIGNPQVGDRVFVSGRLLPDGSLVADLITLLSPSPENQFALVGEVESMGSAEWVIAGRSIAVDEATEIGDDIEAGDRVRVEGVILEDGTLLAERIEPAVENNPFFIEFVGTVTGIDPWSVNDLDLIVDEDSEIDDDIEEGDLVRVMAIILPDGTWLATEIERLDDEKIPGCWQAAAQVLAINGVEIVLDGWPTVTLDDEIDIEGDLDVNSVIIILICTNEDGETTIVSIIVIYQIVTPPPPPPDDDDDDNDDDDDDDRDGSKVTICHRPPGNPNNARTISVGAGAVSAHLGHGDTRGACP